MNFEQSSFTSLALLSSTVPDLFLVSSKHQVNHRKGRMTETQNYVMQVLWKMVSPENS